MYTYAHTYTFVLEGTFGATPGIVQEGGDGNQIDLVILKGGQGII